MPTPIEEAIDKIDAFISDGQSHLQSWTHFEAQNKSRIECVEYTVSIIIKTLNELLPKEKEAIEQAYDKGAVDGMLPFNEFENGKDYFSKTFNNGE
jgi:hypothetical protein